MKIGVSHGFSGVSLVDMSDENSPLLDLRFSNEFGDIPIPIRERMLDGAIAALSTSEAMVVLLGRAGDLEDTGEENKAILYISPEEKSLDSKDPSLNAFDRISWMGLLFLVSRCDFSEPYLGIGFAETMRREIYTAIKRKREYKEPHLKKVADKAMMEDI